MPINKEKYQSIVTEIKDKATLVAVSKTKPAEDILELYQLGHKTFGENYVQELTEKYEQLPKDIQWHYIGHLQSNKVKYIAPFVHLIESVDSLKLLLEISKQAKKNNRVIDVLLQIHISKEETKFGLDENELKTLIETIKAHPLENVFIKGLMGMASFSKDLNLVRCEFQYLKKLFDSYESIQIPNCKLSILSMGMSGDYTMAIEEGSNLVRIGSLIFGERK